MIPTLRVDKIGHLWCVYGVATCSPQLGSQFDTSGLIRSTSPSHQSGWKFRSIAWKRMRGGGVPALRSPSRWPSQGLWEQNGSWGSGQGPGSEPGRDAWLAPQPWVLASTFLASWLFPSPNLRWGHQRLTRAASPSKRCSLRTEAVDSHWLCHLTPAL